MMNCEPEDKPQPIPETSPVVLTQYAVVIGGKYHNLRPTAEAAQSIADGHNAIFEDDGAIVRKVNVTIEPA
jgi:hypothetical protein